MSVIKIADNANVMQKFAVNGELKDKQSDFGDLLFDLIDSVQDLSENAQQQESDIEIEEYDLASMLVADIQNTNVNSSPVSEMKFAISKDTIVQNADTPSIKEMPHKAISLNEMPYEMMSSEAPPVEIQYESEIPKELNERPVVFRVDSKGEFQQIPILETADKSQAYAEDFDESLNQTREFEQLNSALKDVIAKTYNDVGEKINNKVYYDNIPISHQSLLINSNKSVKSELKHEQAETNDFTGASSKTANDQIPTESVVLPKAIMHDIKQTSAILPKAIMQDIKQTSVILPKAMQRDIKQESVFNNQFYYRRDIQGSVNQEDSVQETNQDNSVKVPVKQNSEFVSELISTDTENAELKTKDVMTDSIHPSPYPKGDIKSIALESKTIVKENVTLDNVFTELTNGFGLVEKGDKKQITLVLTPENLGKISMQVTSDEKGITAHIVADSLRVRDEIQNQSPELKEILSGQGFKVNSIEVQYKGSSDSADLFAGFNNQKGQSHSHRKYEQNSNYRSQKQDEKGAIAAMLSIMTEDSAGLNYLA